MSIRSNLPYTPSFMKASTNEGKPLQMSYSDLNMSDTNHGSIDSFKYDPLGYPLKNTQQLNLDWSKFENHTFFSSAEVKVNEAFNKIINGYPFDGTKKEVEEFLDSLTGFEKWVFDSFPKWAGALHFSGSGGASSGTWISVKDKSGTTFPALAKNKTGETILTPGDDTSMSIEMLMKLPEQSNGIQVVFQKSSSDDMGFSFHLEKSTSVTDVTAVFSVTSGSFRNSVSGLLKKGVYNHVCLVLNKQDSREDELQFFLNESLYSKSSSQVRFKKLNIDDANFLIGSGSSFYNLSSLVKPKETLSGTIDEFRLFHSVRDTKNQSLYSSRGVFATPDLKLYFRFNEPSGSLSLNGSNSIESIVLDSSGNSLHANINDYKASLRINAENQTDNVLTNERQEFKTILFPAYQGITELNTQLLTSGSAYDKANPNLILKLIPRHYLLEGASQDGFSTIEGDGGTPYGGSGIPGQGVKGSVQIILSFLYIWAKFFDEIKTYIDSFVTLRTVKYDEEDSIPDNFLEDMVKYYGFYLPKFFNHASVDQFAEGVRIDGLTDIGTPLKKIQALILRRVLVNMPDIIKSKGTQHSIKSFLRSVGIDPENSIRIREYGGPTTKQLTASREKRIEPGAMVDFTSTSFLLSSPLSASRVEPGYPGPSGIFQKNSSNQVIGTNKLSDGMLTSGSWNLECVFKIPPQKLSSITDEDGNQSLMRMIVTGSSATAGPGLVLNVVATQYVDHPQTPATVQAYIRPGFSSSSPLLKLSLGINGKGIFDGEKWNVAVGCERNDEIDSAVSSSYYLRVAKNDAGELNEVYVTSSFFLEQTSEGNAFRSGSTQYNVSGTFVCLGGGQSIPTLSSYYFLNNTLNVPDIARTLDFIGWASNLKFWSKSMSEDEWREHARNPKSFGVDNPLVNYNFTQNVSGSFQKLRLDSLNKQPERDADSSGKLKLLDFSQNENHVSAVGFLTGSRVLIGELFNYSYLSPMFDEASTDDKIRIRSFLSSNLIKENPGAVDTPSYLSNDVFLQEEPQDDLRLSIEFSMVDSLDKDIISMFSSLDSLNNMIGSPELMFSPDYPDLERLRDVYFNRLSGKPDFRKFLEFYRWFDTSISSFIEQLIPSKTLYKGTNFVVESHMLERHKNMYRHSGNYLGERQVIEDSLLVQQIVGKLKKY